MSFRLLLAAVAAALFGTAVLPAASWDPIDPTVLQATQPPPDAASTDSEYISVKHTLDSNDRRIFRTVVARGKVYTVKGAEKAAKHVVHLRKGDEITEIAARVLKGDGRILELKDDDFVHSRASRHSDQERGRVTFTLPELAPGDMFDVSWTVGRYDLYATNIAFAQLALPVRNFEYTGVVREANVIFYWMNNPETTSERKGNRTIIRMKNLPAFEEESYMPPRADLLPWVGSVRVNRVEGADELWEWMVHYYDRSQKDLTAPTRALRAQAAKLTEGINDPVEKLQALYRFVQRDLVHIDYDRSPESRAARERLQAREEPLEADLLLKEKRVGSVGAFDVFHALARAAGFEPTYLRVAHADDTRKVNTSYGWAFARDQVLLFNVAGQEILLRPSDPFIPFGQIPWYLESATAVVASSGKPQFLKLPTAAPSENRVERKGEFTLDADGNLSGEVEIRFAGEEAWDLRESAASLEASETFEPDLVAGWTARLPQASLTDLKWEGLGTSEGPLVLRAKLNVPGYAEIVGNRWSVAADPFSRGKRNEFLSAERKYPVTFSHATQVYTQVIWTYPADWQIEAPMSPAPLGTDKSTLGATYRIASLADAKRVEIKREVTVGRGGVKDYPLSAFPAVKRFHELLEQQDDQRLFFVAP